MSSPTRQLISFDWALKRVLRSKANYRVLEGFLSELLGEELHITELLESESNREHAADRSNRVDLLVRDARDRRVLIELQYSHEGDYFHRMIFGTSKIVTESINSGDLYGTIARVISVNIVYFDLGQGSDYIYTGNTEFRGLHSRDLLELSPDQRQLFKAENVAEIFPQYYILKVKNFNAVAKTGLDEWMQFFKTGEIAKKCHARGLEEAKSVFDLLKLSPDERADYEAFIKEQRIAGGVAQSTILRLEQVEHELKEKSRQKEEECRRADTAQRQAEDAQRQKSAILEKAVVALVAQGMTETAARRLLE